MANHQRSVTSRVRLSDPTNGMRVLARPTEPPRMERIHQTMAKGHGPMEAVDLINHLEAGGIVAVLLVVWARLEKRLTRCEKDHKQMREYLMRIHGDR